MTTTDKLRMCAEFMGAVVTSWDGETQPYYFGTCYCIRREKKTWSCGSNDIERVWELLLNYGKYNESFEWLMSLWTKIRGELEKLELGERVFEKILNDWMHVCCFHSHDPSKAFEVACEAIQLINKTKSSNV